MQSIYADGATHNDHHREINIQGNVSADALEHLMKGFFSDAEEEEVLDSEATAKQKQMRHRVKPEPEEEPQTQEVFSLKNSSLPHMQLLWMRLIELGWITADDMQAFLDLFSGKPNECVITWTGKVGVGTLKELFARMIKNGIIKSVNNYVSIIEAHFVDKDSNYLTHVKGGKPNAKTIAEIDNIIPKLKLQYDITKDIEESFSDLRYGEKQMMDEHKDYYDR